MMPKIIDRFSGKYEFLSNFYFSPIRYEGLWYTTVEHAFQAAKTLDKSERDKIASLATPGKAKRAGRKVKLRTDWERVKVNIMTDLVYQKFLRSTTDLLDDLIGTKNATLIESNYWHDNFWGNCTCMKCRNIKGQNTLGRILMNIREEVK